jgi:D-xylose 1-dehydrogenase (NADP+, D-xylono-1,5-lactone-forming)
MNIVRWGLLSTANINRRVIPAIRAEKRAQLAAVASRDLSKGQAYAKDWEIPRVFGSYEEMLHSDEVDAVYISLPNHLHCEWTVKALEAGKHVLVEKPFAITVDEADRMIAASQKSGRVLQEAFMYRHHPQTKLVGEWIRQGRLGDILLVRAAFSFFMSNREGNVRLAPEKGGGALWDVGIYPISFAQYVYSQLPDSASGQQWVGSTGVDESFAGLLSYSGGRAAQLYGGFSIPFYVQADIHGSKGRLSLTRPFSGMDEPDRRLVFTPVDGEPQELQVENPELYLGEVTNMDNAILDGAPTLVKHEESRNHVRVAVALYEAAKTHQTVKV